MLDVVGKRYLYFLLSALIILPGLVSLLMPGGVRLGIDFTGGAIMTLRVDDVTPAELREAFADLGHPEAVVQRSGDEVYLVRTAPLEPEQRDEAGNVVAPSERQRIEEALRQRFGDLDVLAFDFVSPVIAREVVVNALIALGAACVGILVYLWWAFRKVKQAYRYGTCAVIALVHDTLVTMGVYSILGRFFPLEIDAMFVTAMLTMIGFSVHDTIVVFDRIRENLLRYPSEQFERVVNHSIMQTVGRSLNTSLTVLLTLAALALFGGSTIRGFVVVLIVGITAGTYSSIFNASQLLVVWERDEIRRWWRALRGQEQMAAA